MRFRPDFRMSSFTTPQRASDPSERSERIRNERLTGSCKSDNEKVQSSEKAVFDSSTEITPNFLKTEVREVAVLQAILSAFANCVFVDRLIYLRKKQEEN